MTATISELLIGASCALLGAIIGAFLGAYFTRIDNKKRTEKMEHAFYYEFQHTSETLINWFQTLVEEYNNPLRNEYSGLPNIDLSLVDALVVELAATDRMVTTPNRQLILRMKPSLTSLHSAEIKRDEFISSWLTSGHLMDNEKKRECRRKIKYFTGRLLIDVTQLIFYLQKLDAERERFVFMQDVSRVDMVRACCITTGMNYDHHMWIPLLKQYGLEHE
ncbi:hypothetical protein [Vibrio sp. ABG19]|uniref:hypothetical protein n=1 Tax=Vibrio sp. ABG19 TaxID=2817385 RepID=UPI00249F2F58|nr:hypothetical protein [Vibrio sp. ABG19]WGY44996.1 hypothetical protein J0X00_04640 [Vibrio sp. ABG19]